MPLITPEFVNPTGPQSEMARECLESLDDSSTGKAGDVVALQTDEGQELRVPVAAFRLFVQALREMAKGHAVTLVPIHAELTTQQVADILNVSRPYVVRLLEKEEIPHIKRGRHRRVRFEDLMAYKAQDDLKRKQARAEMISLSQELGFGY
jgi:excisionase family DNA binding protein